MTFYQGYDKGTVKRVINKMTERTCPYCSGTYTVGVDGVVDGCDRCIGITRNADGMIVATRDPQDMPK